MENKILPYDKTSPEDIEKYAKNLIGRTFKDILEDNFAGEDLKKQIKYYNNPRSKGGLGNLLEEFYFYYKPNNDSEPDFIEAGTELKVTPYEITQTKKIRAGERLVIGMIPNREPIERDFYKSHLLKKIRLMLIILYLRIKGNERTDFSIDYVALFSILSDKCKEDLQIIKEDYRTITDKIIEGKAHELSEGDTKYLGACTKGGTAKSSIQPQYYNKNMMAKRRAFSFKQGYMSYIINHYILNDVVTYDSAFTPEELENTNFDIEVVNRIKKYIGKTESEIYKIFDIKDTIKQKNNIAVCRMLGVKTDRIAEFEKADIKIKTVRIRRNGKPKESMSFPTMILKEFAKEEFEESEVYNYFSETRFLLVVFKEQENGEYKLIGSKFWNMPIGELESTGKREWERFKSKVNEGINFTFKRQKNGIIVNNDLPKQKDTEIFHLRPHASKSAYLIDGKRYGAGIDSDMDELPNGDKMTKQCFWLNYQYVANIVNDI